MIDISRLNKRYANAAQPALDNVSLHVAAGEIFGLLGPNGAGKTTLISILTGMLSKDGGKLVIGGINLDDDIAAIRRLIGYVPQDLAFYPGLTVRENLRLFSALSFAPLQQLDFSIEIADLAKHLGKLAHTLSGGLQRRLNLAIGLLGQPKLLCLDEPTAGVDPQSRHFLIETVKTLGRQGMTVLYTTHYLEEIERACTRIAILDQGRIIAEGTLDRLLAQSGGNLESLFLRMTRHELRDS
ncbi:MAG: ABC transporter ATP-binding protein [Stenotrophobium sp.]